MTPGLLARATTGMYSEIRTWNWHDYSERVTYTVDKSGKVNMATSGPILGKYRTNTFFKSEWAAREEVGENKVKDNRKFGGWIGTSKFGSGEDNAFEPSAGKGARYVDYGKIASTIAGLGALLQPLSAGMSAIKVALLKNDKAGNTFDFLKKMGLIDKTGSTPEKSELKYCKDCQSYIRPDSEKTEETPQKGEKVDTVDYCAHK